MATLVVEMNEHGGHSSESLLQKGNNEKYDPESTN